jgi:hypothetical protein
MGLMNKSIFFLFSVLLMACTDIDNIAIPDSVIPKEKMAEVMLDIQLLEATLNINVGNENKAVAQSSINIFSRHQITKEQFEESYTFYAENPELLTEIYQLVLNDLSKLQAEVMNGK